MNRSLTPEIPKEAYTPNEIANEIRQMRSELNEAFLVVEGIVDKRIYNQLVDEEICKIHVSYGKQNAICILDILEKDNFDGILAIVDADFDRLEKRNLDRTNLFMTDTHDLETMIIKSPALEKLLGEYGSINKISNKDVRQILIDSGIHIGYLRWVSEREKLSLKFEGLSFVHFIDNNTLIINVKLMIANVINKSVINKSQRHDLNIDILQKSMIQLSNLNNDPWDTCCGHDFTEILSFGLRKTLGTNNANDVKLEQIEKILRLSYEKAYFLSTQLYRSLKDWETNNRLFRIFPIE